MQKTPCKSSLSVRVLLDEGALGKAKKIELQAEHGFIVTCSKEKMKKKTILVRTLEVEISATGKLCIQGRFCKHIDLRIAPRSGAVRYGDFSYQGSLWLIAQNQQWYLINIVNLEDYVYSVLRWESWPGWPLEVNKAFAVACRSYVMAQIAHAKKIKRTYHVKNTNIHQMYRGIHSDEKLKKAVEHTRGLVMTFNDQPIEAMFDSCCGGVIPCYLDEIDFVKAPYLARQYPCTFCKTYKIYSWLAEYDIDDFCQLLQKSGHGIDHVRDIKIIEKGMAGIVKKIMIKGKKNILQLNGKQLYAAIPQVKSFCYSIDKKGKKILIKGRGYGHHLGMCQWGARNMIDIGWNYTGILKFYYPGIRFMKLV